MSENENGTKTPEGFFRTAGGYYRCNYCGGGTQSPEKHDCVGRENKRLQDKIAILRLAMRNIIAKGDPTSPELMFDMARDALRSTENETAKDMENESKQAVIEDMARVMAAKDAEIERLQEALAWYGEHSDSIAKHWQNSAMLEALMVELKLDGGRRNAQAVARKEAPHDW